MNEALFWTKNRYIRRSFV